MVPASGQPSPRVLPSFTSTSGPTPQNKNEAMPLSVFQLMVTIAVLESIVKQTLLYATSKGSGDFTEFYLEELQAFIGINIAMGYPGRTILQDQCKKRAKFARSCKFLHTGRFSIFFLQEIKQEIVFLQE